VNGRVETWLRAWRSERVVLVSPLPVETVRTRLIEGTTSYVRSAFAYGGWGDFRVVGRVGTQTISLQAVAGGLRNSWRPVARGRLEPVGTGSRFVGTLGWSPFVRTFSAVWLGGVGLIFVVLVGHAITLTWAGDASAGVFLVCLAPVGFVLFFIGLTSFGIWAGRREEKYLRSWMADRLQAPGGPREI
jgi:hypothetical protein